MLECLELTNCSVLDIKTSKFLAMTWLFSFANVRMANTDRDILATLKSLIGIHAP